MARDSKAELSEAVRECLGSCYGTDYPLAALGEYVELLKQRAWAPSEIHKVEAAVTKILLAVASQKECDSFIRRIIKPRSGTFPEPASGNSCLPPPEELNSDASTVAPKRSR